MAEKEDRMRNCHHSSITLSVLLSKIRAIQVNLYGNMVMMVIVSHEYKRGVFLHYDTKADIG